MDENQPDETTDGEPDPDEDPDEGEPRRMVDTTETREIESPGE